MRERWGVEFRGYSTLEDEAMLDIVVNGYLRYKLGPFVNKVQRMVLVEDLKRAVHKLNQEYSGRRRDVAAPVSERIPA